MSEADEYRQYATEAMRWINDCADPEERLVLISLARTWLKAAAVKEPPAEREARIRRGRTGDLNARRPPTPH